jgi:hypothetical protein
MGADDNRLSKDAKKTMRPDTISNLGRSIHGTAWLSQNPKLGFNRSAISQPC